MTADVSVHVNPAADTLGIEGALSDHLASDHGFVNPAVDSDINASPRPFWDILGTWESANLEDHELRYRELKRLHQDDPGVNAQLKSAILTARRVCGA